MNNAEKFREVFGAFATEVWAMPEDAFLKWLKSDTKSASIEPRKEGRWIEIPDDIFAPIVVCSRCRQTAMVEDCEYQRTRYCPNCGAYMRERGENA